MSYILDALRKADRERQRGTVPTLQGEPVLAAAPTQNMFLVYLVVALALLAVGLGIGWWQPWRSNAVPLVAAPLTPAAAPTAPAVVVAVPMPVSPPAAPPPAPVAPPLSVPAPVAATPTASPAAPVILAPPPPPIPTPAPSVPALAVEPVQPAAEVLALEDLPPAVRQELPNLTVQLHAYSSVPKERLVSVNDKLLREGDRISAALRLEQITKDGMIFSFKGYRFRRGVQ